MSKSTYDLVDNLRKETFERLDKISDDVTEIKVSQAVNTTKLTIIIAGISIVTSASVSLILWLIMRST